MPGDLQVQDARSVMLNRAYARLLGLSAVVGLIVSFAAWAFLTVVPVIQDALYVELPGLLGFSEAPWWWAIPVLLVAGLITALVIAYLPGRGGDVPADGLSSGLTEPITLPGIVLASLATLGFGLVLGPSTPAVALGIGLGLFMIRYVARDTPENVQQIVATAGGFAALAMVFNNPIVGAIVLIEAIGIGGAMAPVIVLPGLLAAGIGSLVYLGMGRLTGLSTAAYAQNPIDLPAIETLTLADFGWTFVLALLCPVLGVAVVAIGKRTNQFVQRANLIWVPAAGLAVALLAILFAQITGEDQFIILFSGSKALDSVILEAETAAILTVIWLLVFKAAAWSISMGAFRGGPVFPAVFIGAVAGVLAANIPGLNSSVAVPVAVAATFVAVLRQPLTATVVALMLTASVGLRAAPLVITAVVIAYLASEAIQRTVTDRQEPDPTRTP